MNEQVILLQWYVMWEERRRARFFGRDLPFDDEKIKKGGLSVGFCNEEINLAVQAAKSADSKGRLRAEDPCPLRNCFQRDRDRIIHAKAFRRLMHKTQVFISPDQDHYRTRLTHTLEVAQISRTIARALHLNEDLVEAIALGHDLGHTPFGHAGERSLQLIRPDFRHNKQSLRVVDVIEKEGRGLNLTYEVRDGIVSHSGEESLPRTLEGGVVRLADRVAYVNHDIDDAMRAGLIQEHQIPAFCKHTLGANHSQRIHAMVVDIVAASHDLSRITMSPAVGEAMDLLRQFLFAKVYQRKQAHIEEEQIKKIIFLLYEYYAAHDEALPGQFAQDPEGLGVCDYIAGMTDRFALNQYIKLGGVLPAGMFYYD